MNRVLRQGDGVEEGVQDTAGRAPHGEISAGAGVKLIHPLFVLFYLFLLCRQFVSAFRKGGVYLLSDKYTLKLLQIGQEMLKLFQNQLI